MKYTTDFGISEIDAYIENILVLSLILSLLHKSASRISINHLQLYGKMSLPSSSGMLGGSSLGGTFIEEKPPPREIESDQILYLIMLHGTENDANTFTTRNYRKLGTSCVRTLRQSI